MELNLDKCTVFHAKKGEVHDPENCLEIISDTFVKDLGIKDNYKFLGLKQLLGIAHTTARKKSRKRDSVPNQSAETYKL
jgi:hypothetical protein